jgi:hypothetical protein
MRLVVYTDEASGLYSYRLGQHFLEIYLYGVAILHSLQVLLDHAYEASE